MHYLKKRGKKDGVKQITLLQQLKQKAKPVKNTREGSPQFPFSLPNGLSFSSSSASQT